MLINTSSEIERTAVLPDVKSKVLSKIEEAEYIVYFKKGQNIFHEGICARGVYYIKSGLIKFSLYGKEGKEQIVRFGNSGDIVGYRSVLSQQPISTNIIALSDVTSYFIPKNIFLKYISNDKKFTEEVLKVACQELGEACKIITNFAQKNARERLVEVLLILRNTYSTDEHGYTNIHLKREEYANTIGTATETVVRYLKEFKQLGIVALKGRKIKMMEHNLSSILKLLREGGNSRL